MIEGWTGTWLNMPLSTDDGRGTAMYWNETFTRSGGGQFDGLAMGIMGDVVSF